MRRHIRDIKDTLLSEGVTLFQIDHLRSGHIRIATDIGPLFVGSTPSDHRWLNKFKSHIRRSKK